MSDRTVIIEDKFIAVLDHRAAKHFRAENYTALENGYPHTLSREDVERVGLEFDTYTYAVLYLLAEEGGGWVFDSRLDTTWHRSTSPPALLGGEEELTQRERMRDKYPRGES